METPTDIKIDAGNSLFTASVINYDDALPSIAIEYKVLYSLTDLSNNFTATVDTNSLAEGYTVTDVVNAGWLSIKDTIDAFMSYPLVTNIVTGNSLYTVKLTDYNDTLPSVTIEYQLLCLLNDISNNFTATVDTTTLLEGYTVATVVDAGWLSVRDSANVFISVPLDTTIVPVNSLYAVKLTGYNDTLPSVSLQYQVFCSEMSLTNSYTAYVNTTDLSGGYTYSDVISSGWDLVKNSANTWFRQPIDVGINSGSSLFTAKLIGYDDSLPNISLEFQALCLLNNVTNTFATIVNSGILANGFTHSDVFNAGWDLVKSSVSLLFLEPIDAGINTNNNMFKVLLTEYNDSTSTIVLKFQLRCIVTDVTTMFVANVAKNTDETNIVSIVNAGWVSVRDAANVIILAPIDAGINTMNRNYTVGIVGYDIYGATCSVKYQLFCKINIKNTLYTANVDLTTLAENYSGLDVVAAGWLSVKDDVNTLMAEPLDVGIDTSNTLYTVKLSEYNDSTSSAVIVDFQLLCKLNNKTFKYTGTVDATKLPQGYSVLDVVAAGWLLVKDAVDVFMKLPIEIDIDTLNKYFTVKVSGYNDSFPIVVVQFQVVCLTNNRVSVHIADVDTTLLESGFTKKQVVDAAWLLVKDTVVVWAGFNIIKGAFETFRPSTVSEGANIDVTIFNDNFKVNVTRFELYPVINPTNWCVGFNVEKKDSRNVKMYADELIPLTEHCNNTYCINIVNAVWLKVEGRVTAWADKQYTYDSVLNTDYVPGGV